MARCPRCGEKFDRDEAEYQFSNEYSGLNYDHLSEPLCFECARSAMEAEEPGIYMETCEQCGSSFDYFQAKSSLAYDDPRYMDADLQFVWDKTGSTLYAQCASEHLSEVYYSGDDGLYLFLSRAAWSALPAEAIAPLPDLVFLVTAHWQSLASPQCSYTRVQATR